MGVGGANPNAWRNWYHVIGTTYGTWLRGDPRGFRTFQHRQHIEGDYHNPPAPGTHTVLFERSKQSLLYPPVEFSFEQCCVVCAALADKLCEHQNEVRAIALMPNHFHALVRFAPLPAHVRAKETSRILRDGRDPAPRHFIGLARKHASFELKAKSLKPEGSVWAARPKCEPIADEGHFRNTARYIIRHGEQGGAVFDSEQGFLFERH